VATVGYDPDCPCAHCEYHRRKEAAELEARSRAKAQAQADRRRREEDRAARAGAGLEAAKARGFWCEGEDRSADRGDGPRVELRRGWLCGSAPCYIHPGEWEAFRGRLRAAGGWTRELPSHANRMVPSTYLFNPMRTFDVEVSVGDLDAAGRSRLAGAMAEGLKELWAEARSRVAR
jgi:hypothetical protein